MSQHYSNAFAAQILALLRPWRARKVTGAEVAQKANSRVMLRSWVGHKLTINGDMGVDEFGLRIDGRVIGNVTSVRGLVMVGMGGSVWGTVCAPRIIVAGEVKGNLFADGVVECTDTAQVQGHIIGAGVVIHAGASVKGTMSIIKKQLPTLTPVINPSVNDEPLAADGGTLENKRAHG